MVQFHNIVTIIHFFISLLLSFFKIYTVRKEKEDAPEEVKVGEVKEMKKR
jgi:hypothetical protein